MSGAARARAKPAKRGRTLAERIQELTARAAAEKKKKELKDQIAAARRELQTLRRK